jgi:hypothetical protein
LHLAALGSKPASGHASESTIDGKGRNDDQRGKRSKQVKKEATTDERGEEQRVEKEVVKSGCGGSDRERMGQRTTGGRNDGKHKESPPRCSRIERYYLLSRTTSSRCMLTWRFFPQGSLRRSMPRYHSSFPELLPNAKISKSYYFPPLSLAGSAQHAAQTSSCSLERQYPQPWPAP